MKKSASLPASSKILLACGFLSCASSFAFPLLSTILVTRTSLSAASVAWVMCAAFLLSAVFQPKIGALLDEGKDRAVLAMAAAGALIGISGIYVSQTATAWLIPALVVFITSFSSVSTAGSRILEGTASDESRGQAALLLMGTVNFGFAVSSILAFFYLQTRQSQLLLLDAVTTLIYIWALYRYRPAPAPSRGQASSAPEASGPGSESRPAALAGTFLIFISTAACLSAIPLLYAKQGAFGNQMAPVMFGLCNVVVAVLGIGFSSAINEIPLGWQIACSAGLFAVGHALLPWVDSEPRNAVVTIIWSIGEVFAYPVTARLVFASYPASQAGKAAGVKGGLMRLAMAATPALAALTVDADPRIFSVVFGLIPLGAGGLLYAASLRQERAGADEPRVSLQAWIQAHFRRSVLLFLSAALALIFSVESFLMLRERLHDLDDSSQAFISSQLPNLQVYDFARMNSDLEIFARNEPLDAARMIDANEIVVGRWSRRPEDGREPRRLRLSLTRSASRTVEFVYDGGLGRVLVRTPARDNSGAVLGTLELSVPCFLFLKSVLLSGFAWLAVMALTYLFGLRLSRAAARAASGPLEAISKALQTADQPQDLAELRIAAEIAETEQLLERFRQLGERLRDEELRRMEAERQEAIGEIASQVAHDIRSPLAALDSVMKDLGGLPEDKRSILRSAVMRIRDIANDLLEKNRDVKAAAGSSISEMIGACSQTASVQLLSSHMDSLVSEKRLQHRARIGVEIDGRIDASSYGLFARIQPTEFKRALSNLVNNSVEAIAERGTVSVELSREDGRVVLRVRDDGKGIPHDVMPRLGRKGETHGKAGGSGLGLFHARTAVESWGGQLEIRSELGRGTVVTIRLPRAPAPAWFVSELELKPGSTVVVLDDDSSIHHVWQGRFDSRRVREHGVETLHFSTSEELRSWLRSRAEAAADAVFLVDYELLGSSENGLSLIAEFGLEERAILVTSRFEERTILDDCLRLGVRLIPKGMAGFVPIRVPETSYDAVLIDDDKLVRAVWSTAAKAHGKTLKVFETPAEFEGACSGLDRATPIYVDSRLGGGIKGEEFARRLSEKGFERLILCTGDEPAAFRGMDWLSGVVGKDAPWT